MESTGCLKKLTKHIRSHIITYAYPVFLAQLVVSTSASGNPTDGNIVGGSGSIGHSGTVTNIQQNSSNMAIQWSSFNIQQNETVNFNQPDQSSIVLNRVMDINPSQIQGAINANGQVIIANPNGVFFGPTANVNVGGLFAAALDISPADFMNGKLDFSALENTTGVVSNEGTLRVIDGGTLALMGQQVRNSGLLVANFGMVNLIAGGKISVTFEDYDNVNIGIDTETLANILELDSVEIFNDGLIQAHGGRVVLTAQQASDIKSSITPTDERLHATQFVVQDGVVYLTGNDGLISDLGGIDVSSESGNAGSVIYEAENIQHNGVINADSQNGNGGSILFNANDTTLLTGNSSISAQSHQNGTGGEIKVLGNHVGLTNNANIDASGTNGGGKVYIGGGYQGVDPNIKNAEAVYLGESTSIKANATNNGDGGQIVVWSDNASRVYGALSATGGSESGNGGQIETSSHDYVDLNPQIDVHAENGQHGEWLIDPANLIIDTALSTNSNISGIPNGPNFTTTGNDSTLKVTNLQNALTLGSNIIIQTSVETIEVPLPVGCTPGVNCNIVDPQSETSPYTAGGFSAGGNISLGTAATPVNLDYNGSGATVGSDNASSLTLRAHRDINIYGSISDSDTANSVEDILNLTLTADWVGNGTVGTSPQGAGNVNIFNNIDLQGGDFNATGVNFTVNNSGGTDYYDIDTRLPGSFSASPNPGGDVTINMTGNVILGDTFTDGSLTVSAGAGNSISLRDSMTIGGNLILSASGGITDAVADSSDIIDITGTSQLTGGSISLNTAQIDFQNTVTIAGGTSVVLSDINNLTVNINNNSVSSIATNTVGNATISDIDPAGTQLNAMTVGGNLDVTTQGSISDGGIINVNGTSTFRAPAGSNIILDNTNLLTGTVNFLINGAPGNLNNLTFRNDIPAGFNLQDGLTVDGDLNLRAQNITLNNFTLGNTNTLTLTADNGDIIQNNVINHSGTTVLSASGNIFDPVVTNNPVNNLANVQINNTTTASINNGTNAITLNGISNTGDLNIVAQGGITETNTIAVTNTATFDAGTNALMLNSSTHNLNNVQVTAASSVQINETDNINIAGNMASLNVTAGLGGGASSISNITDAPLTVTDATNFTLQNGGSVNLANFTGALRNDLQSIINVTASIGTVNNASIRNTSDIQLGPLNLNNDLNLDSSGNIIQTGDFIVNGTTALQANNITLNQGNNFVGIVTITDSNVVQLNDIAGGLNVVAANTNASNTIDLTLTSAGAVGIEGELSDLNITTTVSDIQSTAALLVSNNTTLDVGATGNVDFQTNPVDLENVTITQANNVQINDTDNLTITNANVNGTMDITALGPVSVNGTISTLNINTNNAITLSGILANLNAVSTTGGIQNGTGALSVSGTSILDAANSDITLNNAANDFNMLEIVSAQDATINDVNTIVLQDINTRDFNLTTGGNVTQSAGTRIASTRDANINASNANIALGENNLFTSLSLTANTATIVNDQALTLADSVLGNSLTATTNNGNLSINQLTATNEINLTAADALVDSNGDDVVNIIANTARLSAVNGIGMGSHIDTQVTLLDAINSTNGDINIKNSGGDITLNNIFNGATDTGNFNFESTNDVFINSIVLQQNLVEDFFSNGTGTVNLFTADGSFLGVGDTDINNPDIIATNLRIIGVKGTLGTIQRPVVLDISGKVELILRASLDPIYIDPVPAPDDIRDESILQFTSGNILSAINGLTLTEVENLLDIDPAVFTDIRHYVVAESPVLLPKDQWFDDGYTDEEDAEFFRQVTGTEKANN
ncbi:MAG: filamentous hemagglutinin N-terminal domain-containing protein [Methylococcales bacterium]